ncbi:uncharacterized protein LOC126672546 [Mercurialis annua]|uniref:uncharacterized protein LOC126672546 n=1 Tax=Mercurialis annua TaxID=3986 RepID=UPI00215EE17D|nr:uncharacterized protein LOC126672546 [Mercurialis annua]
MDFVVGLPKTQNGFDSIWVIADRLTKSAHFIPIKMTYSASKLAEIYIDKIVCLLGVPVSIVSDREITQITSEKVPLIKQRLTTTSSRQKSYADPKRKDIEFQIGDYVFLKVSPIKGVIRFGKKGKLAARYVGPYQIVERIGSVAYKLDLPPEMSQVHPVFHISMLQKYIPDPSRIIQPQVVDVSEELTYEEQPVQIVDTQIRQLRTKRILMVKVLWRS